MFTTNEIVGLAECIIFLRVVCIDKKFFHFLKLF